MPWRNICSQDSLKINFSSQSPNEIRNIHWVGKSFDSNNCMQVEHFHFELMV